MNITTLRRMGIAVGAAALLVAGAVSQSTEVAQAQMIEGPLVWELPTESVVEWMWTVYERVEADAVSAPNGARLYGYAGVTVYESLFFGMPGNRSLVGQLNGLNDLPLPEDGEYDWLSVTNAAMDTVMSGLMPTEDSIARFDELREAQINARIEAGVSEKVIGDSLDYGDTLGEGILAWAAEDNYAEVREMNAAYELPTGWDSAYVLTGGFERAAEPYWGEIRPFAISHADECRTDSNIVFSTEEGSDFYQQAMEVMETGNNLTAEQREIAEWWVDTPSISGTPSGHWVAIANQLVGQFELTLDQTAVMYAMLGPTLADAFISCWSLKYQDLMLRPETYIQRHISARWLPYIQTPPFPEYPSGHSVASAAAADILTHVFGVRSFVDETHVDNGFSPRSFTSFEAAASEAAISRLYGGIHFRTAIENGMRQGRCVAERVADRIILLPVSQGGE